MRKKLIEAIEIHNELNPKLFIGNKLRKDVKDKILKIVDEFKSYVEVPFEVLDILLVGSNASYNYTEHSDLDIHIVTNFENIDGVEDKIAQILFNLERSAFNKAYDINIKGINAEVYVEDVNAMTASNGIYSVTADDWLKFPKKLDNIEQFDFGNDLENWKRTIEKALEQGTLEEVNEIINVLYLFRKNSIAQDGEFSYGNALFKEIRNLGLLDKLKEKLAELKSKELSLESFNIHYDMKECFTTESPRYSVKVYALNEDKARETFYSRYPKSLYEIYEIEK